MSASLTAGDFRERVRIEAKMSAPDGGGGGAESWALEREAFAHVRVASGEEVVSGGAVETRARVIITLVDPGSWDASVLSPVDEARRLVWRGRAMNIRAAYPVGTDRRYVQCVCELGAPS